jgi:hypothetical protein
MKIGMKWINEGDNRKNVLHSLKLMFIEWYYEGFHAQTFLYAYVFGLGRVMYVIVTRSEQTRIAPPRPKRTALPRPM